MKESKRYIANAKETLKKSPVEDNIYTDVKYVKSAFGIAYLGVIEAIREYLRSKGCSEKELPRKVEEYQKALKKHGGVHDGKLLRQFNVIYHEMHIAGYYQGLLQRSDTVKAALKNAEEFIARLKP
jgi:hypothetical protein